MSNVAQWLYCVITVEAQPVAEQIRVPAGYEPGWKIGDVLVESADHGPVYVQAFADAVLNVRVGAVKIGGKITDTNADGSPHLDRDTARLLGLIQMGANGVRTLNDQLVLFAEEIREQIVEPLTSTDNHQSLANFRLSELLKGYTRL